MNIVKLSGCQRPRGGRDEQVKHKRIFRIMILYDTMMGMSSYICKSCKMYNTKNELGDNVSTCNEALTQSTGTVADTDEASVALASARDLQDAPKTFFQTHSSPGQVTYIG